MLTSLTTPLTTAASAAVALVLVLGLAACGEEETPAGGSTASTASTASTTSAAAGKDTPEGCLAAIRKALESASGDADSLPDEPPAECDDLSDEQQQQAIAKGIAAALSELDDDLDKLDPATEKELRDALGGTPTP